MILRFVRFICAAVFVVGVLAWIFVPSYVPLEDRVAFNRTFGAEVAARTGIAALADVNYARVMRREVRAAQRSQDRSQADAARDLARANRPQITEQTVFNRFKGLEAPEDAGSAPAAPGARFVRVGE